MARLLLYLCSLATVTILVAAEPVICGIGALLTVTDRGVAIGEVLPDSPAAEAGVIPGLIILKVDKVEVDAKELVKCVERIRGVIGTEVVLEFQEPKSGKVFEMVLTRALIKPTN